MNLKEQMAADMESLFFDLDDQTIEINFNGQTIMVNQSTARDADYGSQNSPEQGVLEERRTYYFRGIDLDPLPVPWEEVEIDGQEWTVLEVFPMFGAYRITFFREAS
jgi:hypothetical protein